MQLKVKVKDLENTNSYDPADKLIVLTDENTNTSKNLDKSDLLTGIVSTDATNGLNIQNGGLYNKDVSNIIGDLSDLTTPVKSNVVNAVNSIQNTINTDLNNIGDLSNLTTTDKTSLVGAVNEIYNSISANKDLSNLNTTGNNRLHASKGYTESGQVYSDATLYNDILTQYNNSPFDLSKFTVVGTPTITDEGVASGFSTSNYVKTSTISADLSKPFVIEGSFITTSTTTQQTLFGTTVTDTNNTIRNFALQIYTTGVLYLYCPLSVGGNWLVGTTTLTANTQYYYRLVYDGNGGLKWYYGTDQDNLIEQTAGALLGSTLNNYITLGISYSISNPVLGSIDLKQFSITVDGQEVFSGHKTGTDLIITDNYTVVGSPTITDGVASGFSASNDIRTKGFLQNLGNADTWAIELEVTTPSTLTNYQYIMSGGATTSDFQGFVLGMNSNGNFRLYLGGNGTSWNIANSQYSDYTINANTKVKVRLEFSGSKYILSSQLTGQNWVTQKTITSNTKIFNSNLPILFGHNTANSSAYWRGSIDLNTIRVIENGLLVYSSDLSIPYTISNTGAKVVNINQLGSLQMLNNMSGGALYYTIDETNSEAALPFGNVYGLINKRADGEWENLAGSNIELSTVTAVNTYDIDISSYITSNLYDYEAVFDIDAKRTDNNSTATNYTVSLLLNDGTAIANYSNTFYKAQSYGDQFSVLLPKNIRKIRLQISGYALSSHSLKLLAWRRKGGNY